MVSKCGIVEINVHKKKWIMLRICRPPSQNEREFFDELGKVLDTYSVKSNNFVMIDDFNTEEDSDTTISNFMNLYEFAYLVKISTCFNSGNPRCIDLIITGNVLKAQEQSRLDCLIATP